MLREAWWWTTTPCTPWVRGVGLLRESCAIAARARRCAAAWAPHLARCRAAMAAAAPDRGTVAVLGAGWCHDVPLEELSRRCATVTLVDAVIPRPVRRLARRLGNVRVQEADLSGIAAALWARQVPAVPVLPDWTDLGSPDVLISGMLLSQLPLLPLGWAMRQGLVDAARADHLARLVRVAHLDLLARAPASMLITDRLGRHGGDSVDLLPGLDLPAPDQSWEWTVAPAGEAGTEASVHLVEVIRPVPSGPRLSHP